MNKKRPKEKKKRKKRPKERLMNLKRKRLLKKLRSKLKNGNLLISRKPFGLKKSLRLPQRSIKSSIRLLIMISANL